MCGIAGYYSRNGFFSEEHLAVMTDALSHRGPDASGYYHDDTAGLGHRRLSIIDLSERANQPMTSANGRYLIIYNGEVYNYRELGREWKAAGNSLKTSSDTEIILELFARDGVDFISRLNGMFAFAIYDTTLKELYLFRDRIGIKPVYYFWDGRNFAFASELKAFQKLDVIQKEIQHVAIKKFLHLGYIPAPYTIYHNIYKLESGCWMKISEQGIDIRRYWDLEHCITDEPYSAEDEATKHLSSLLTNSVEIQLRSDVPFGVFLSGGIDSSLVAAKAVEQSSEKIKTFSIGFEEVSHNEAEHAKAVAEHLGTDHHEFIVSYKDALHLTDAIFDSYDEPYADSSAIPTMLVSKLARQHVKVALSGDGGDELFFGYGAYQWARRLTNPLVRAMHKPAALALSGMSSRYKRVSGLLDYKNREHLKSHIFSQEQYLFSQEETEKLLSSGFASPGMEIEEEIVTPSARHTFEDFFSNGDGNVTGRKLNEMEKQALFDLHYYLPDDLLVKVDRASMRYSLETRVPILDHRVIELALNISPSLKYRNGTTKYILKKILYQYIPPHLFDRPKRGFAIPLAAWLRNELNVLIQHYLSEEVIKKYGVVKYEEVNRLKTMFDSGTEYVYNRLWLLIVLHKWLEKNT